MASSGSVSTTGYGGRHLVLSWSQVSQSIANNTTTISWTLKGAGSASFSYCYARNFTVVINGVTVLNSQGDSSEVKLYNGTVVGSGSLTIAHNSDGNKSFSVSVTAGIYDWTPNKTGSGTFQLDRIPRISTLSASDGTLGKAQTLTVTRQSSSFTHTITYTCGLTTGTVVTKSSSTSISWTPPLALASENTTGTVVSLTFAITTYSGDTNIGNSTKTVSYSIPDTVAPSCAITLESVPMITNYYDSTWWNQHPVYIQNVTKVRANVTFTGAYGSTIATSTVKMGNASYSGQSVTMSAPTSYGNVTVTATVVDKRGRTGTVTQTISVLKCPLCKITKLVGERCNSDGTANDRGSYIRVHPAYESGFWNTDYGYDDGKPAITKAYYRKHGTSAWTELFSIEAQKYFPNSLVTDDSIKTKATFQADTESSYEIKLTVYDGFNTATATAQVATAYSIMHWKANGKGLGIGKAAELDDTLDIGMSTKFTGGITPILIESGTDLNDVVLPNFYYGNGVSANFSNFPISSSASNGFCIEVFKSGSHEVKQRLTITSTFIPAKTQVFERIRGMDLSGNIKWSAWVCTFETDSSGASTDPSLTDYAKKSDLPTKVSQLENDAGYVKANEVLTADALSDYAKKTELPTKTSQLTNNSGYITSADVPTKVSELQNDALYLSGNGSGPLPAGFTIQWSQIRNIPDGTDTAY